MSALFYSWRLLDKESREWGYLTLIQISHSMLHKWTSEGFPAGLVGNSSPETACNNLLGRKKTLPAGTKVNSGTSILSNFRQLPCTFSCGFKATACCYRLYNVIARKKTHFFTTCLVSGEKLIFGLLRSFHWTSKLQCSLSPCALSTSLRGTMIAWEVFS